MILHVDFKRRSLSTGFSHVALIRNGNIYTWGSSVQGCLGTYICFIKFLKGFIKCNIKCCETYKVNSTYISKHI